MNKGRQQGLASRSDGIDAGGSDRVHDKHDGGQEGPAGPQTEDRQPEQGVGDEGDPSGDKDIEQVKGAGLVSVKGSLQQQRGAHHRPVIGQTEEVSLRQNAPKILNRAQGGIGEDHFVVVIEKTHGPPRAGRCRRPPQTGAAEPTGARDR